MTNRRYTKKVIARVVEADPSSMGAELGRLCILHGYSVKEIAEVFSVSRMTVYNWMQGHHAPQKVHLPKLQRLIEHLREKQPPLLNDDVV